MTLADYCLPGADPDLQEPLASRLLGLLEHFDGRLMILSGRRSRGEQQALYDAWVAGEGNYAAVPGTSKHERRLAADLALFDGLDWPEVHDEAAERGLHFPVYDKNGNHEDWHVEALPAWIPPLPPEIPDMTKEEFAAAIGAEIHPVTGLVCVPLINDRFDGYDLWPFAAAVAYTHEEVKRTRYGK